MKRNNTSSAERRYLLAPPCLQATTHLGAHFMRAQADMAPAPYPPPPFSIPARFLFVDKPMSLKHGAQRE
ncbi:unnamed protein product [Ectocarpus sp. 12 AP-2014]